MADALDNILNQIKLSAENEIAKLQDLHETSCENLVARYEKLIEQEKINLQNKIEIFKKELETKTESENLIFKNKKILETKQKVVNEVLKCAAETLCGSEKYCAQYFKYMQNLIESNLVEDFCILYYGKADFLRFSESLKFRPNSSLKIEQTDEFNWGAKVVCDKFEVDLNVEKLILEEFENNKLEILNALISGEFD